MNGPAASITRGWRHAASAVALAALVAIAASAALPAASPVALAADTPAATAGRGGDSWRLDWCRGSVFYEIFVRSFADSDGDGVGDFRGLSAKLDYLNDGNPATRGDLGVDALWLMPVFASPSYHGYDVTDYERVNPAYGTEADFDSLLTRAHRRGIRVIVDLVLNHSSAEHPWFRDAASGAGAKRRDWYVWRADDPGWTQPWGSGRTWHKSGDAYYYGLFWRGMPDLNFRNPEVREEMKRIATLWLERGVDGFRLDATRHLVETGPGARQNDSPETHELLKEFAAHVRSVKPDAALVGENWTDTPAIAKYFGSVERVAGGDELPMNFNFPVAAAIVDGVRDGSAARIRGTLTDVERLYPPGVLDAPFLTNHDMVRAATQLGSDPGKLRLAAAILLTLPGAPFLYYGEEVGLANGPASGDEAKRTPMPWSMGAGGGFTTGTPWHPFAPGQKSANVAAQTGDAQSLLSRYRALIRARAGSAALRRGSLDLLQGPVGGEAVLGFLREEAGGERVLVLHNVGKRAVRGLNYAGMQGVGLEPILLDGGVRVSPNGAGVPSFSMPPGATGIWRLRAAAAPRR